MYTVDKMQSVSVLLFIIIDKLQGSDRLDLYGSKNLQKL